MEEEWVVRYEMNKKIDEQVVFETSEEKAELKVLDKIEKELGHIRGFKTRVVFRKECLDSGVIKTLEQVRKEQR